MNRNSISNLKVHYKMTYARIIRDVLNEMDSFVCRLNAFGGRRRFIAEWNLDFHFLSPLENLVPNSYM